jgi:hypothetical protein
VVHHPPHLWEGKAAPAVERQEEAGRRCRG